MALSKKKSITIALALADDRLLSRAVRERGVSRSEFIRQHVARALEQYRRRGGACRYILAASVKRVIQEL